MKKYIAILLICISLFSTLTVSAESYTYNYWSEVVSTPDGYIAKEIIDGKSIGVGVFSKPSDIFVDNDNFLYISDTGNNRIICLNPDFSLSWVLSKLYDGSKEMPIIAPKGLFVDFEKNIYICLDESTVIVKCDRSGKILMKYTAPESKILPKEFQFKPSHVLVSEGGTLYALIEGFHLGALTYNAQGEFLTFFGGNDVKLTPQMIANKLMKKLMTEEQKSKLSRSVPVQYDNFDIDTNGFIYSCTKEVNSQEIRRLNTLGDNVLQYQGNMGDLQSTYVMGKSEDTRFVDICVDNNGFISALDENRGRVFQYDREGELMTIFGGAGDGLGCFENPCAVESIEDKILVLDKELSSITVFQLTKFGNLLHQGNILFRGGFYGEAEDTWRKVLEMDVNNELAYNGLGKSLHAEEKYSEAMECFKKANSREEYSESFKLYRSNLIRKYFPIVIPILIFAILGLVVLNFLIKKRKIKKIQIKLPEAIKSILRVCNHPVDECSEIKFHNSWNVPIATFIIFLFVVAIISNLQLKAFIFNTRNLETFNVLLVSFFIVAGYLLYVCVNWAVTTLISGKGKMKEIYCACSYALLPFIATTIISVICSNFMILDERPFLILLQLFGLIWTAFIMVSVLRVIHEYSFVKVFVSLFLTACGMAFVVFIVALFVSLVEQLISFIRSIYNELMYRR